MSRYLLTRCLIAFVLSWTFVSISYADRIYIMNGPGYNTAEYELVAAIAVNGHVVDVNNYSLSSLPSGFTTTCIDPLNGYDWLCFFGDIDFSGLTSQIQEFIDSGGKVFYQYEVSCCTNSSSSVASILSDLTGTSITPNSNSHIAANMGDPGYMGNISCCTSFIGAAYKGLDGLPLENQMQADSTFPGSAPPIGTCLNFGFSFSTSDFVGTSNKGAMIGFGDVNIWYDGDEPFSNGGVTPINTSVVDYIFPNDSTTCYAFPPGCMNAILINHNLNLGNDTTICKGDTLVLDATTSNATYLWQDNSTKSTFNVTQQGTYWVKITNNCENKTDTITINEDDCTIILEIPNVFTPNNDGLNDLFVPIISKGIVSMSTIVCNRWGNTVFKSDNLLIEWNGQGVSDGTYFWIVYYTDKNGIDKSLTGSVTILK